ncbi:MAG: amidohydrolase [Kordiimonadaceae bacterium]|nr:amidohydrolase [Kordiimonadaceae bacterium]MBT6466679.1 amidohydrolase [Kordiimonadaceae bacterium]MBT7545297.1 amidohydrolase [Kordiimonadaceae bacterium]
MKNNLIYILVIAAVIYILFFYRDGDIAEQVQADMILQNGTIYTANDAQWTAAAVAIKGDEIIFVGSVVDAQNFIGENTNIFDLGGDTVFPGLTDAHTHIKWVGQRELGLNLQNIDDLGETVEAIRLYAENIAEGDWIIGKGWIEQKWADQRFLNKSDVDYFSKNKPLVVTRGGEHSILANSKAMEIAGITRDTPDPAGGSILKDENGEPSGMFIDNAMALIRNHIPAPTREEEKKSLQAGLDFMSRMGWTQVQEAGGDYADVELLKEIHAEGKLKTRLYYFMLSGEEGAKLLERGAEYSEDNMLDIAGIKYFGDGGLGSRGAALLEPYDDENTSGLVLIDGDKALDVYIEALKKGIQIETHAIGDYTNRFVLDLYEEAFKAVPEAERVNENPRWRIEHAQIIHPDDQIRYKELGIIAAVEASTVKADLYFAPARIGSERLKTAYLWKTLIDQGIHVTAGTDAPVEVGDPRVEFFSLVARTDFNGFYTDDWNIDEKVDHKTALKMMTINAAYAAFQEDIRGSIEVGKKADFSIFDKDWMTIEPSEIMDSEAVMTIVGGRVTYSR